MTTPEITKERGHEAIQRLINSHFGNPNPARTRIPADRANDDDLVAFDYVLQLESALAQAREEIEQDRANRKYIMGLAWEQAVRDRDEIVSLKALVEQLEGQLAKRTRNADFLRSMVGSCHLMISRDDMEELRKEEWEETTLPPRLYKFINAKIAQLEHRLAAYEKPEQCSTTTVTYREPKICKQPCTRWIMRDGCDGPICDDCGASRSTPKEGSNG